MSIIPDSDETLIVDQASVNGDGNGPLNSEADEPEADEPEANEPEADDPEADDPETNEPEADEPEANEPEADEPEANEPEANEPEADEPEADEDWGDIRRPPRVPPRWQDIGADAAERHLKDSVVVLHDDASGEDLTWQLRNGQLWELVPKDRATIAERLLVLQHQLVEELRAASSAKAATKVAQAGFADQVRGKVTPFWAGANVVLRKRPRADPPAHLLNTPDGVRDLKSRRTHPLGEMPYLFTSCTSGAPGAFMPGCLDNARMLVEDLLAPSLPDARDRDNLLKAWGQALGGEGGGRRRGSLLWLIGKPGSGKGHTIRFAEDSCGGYCLPADVDAILSKASLNDERANILERNPRIITLSEMTWVAIALLLRVTGRDTLSARSPYKHTIYRRLFCGVNIASSVVPRGRADTGLARRLFGIRFPHAAEVDSEAATDVISQPHRDALVATLIGIAEEMYAQGDDWVGLPDDDPFTAECLRLSDPVMELARELTLADHGRKLSELMKDLTDIGRRPPHGQLSDALRSTGNWEVKRGRHPAGGEENLTRIFWIGPAAAPEEA